MPRGGVLGHSIAFVFIILSLQGVADFEWQPVIASNISHLNLGNQMDMDQVTIINIIKVINNINNVKMKTIMV